VPRRLLQIVPTPEEVSKLSCEELARALLEDMQARAQDPTSGMAQRDDLGVALVTQGLFPSISDPGGLQRELNRAGGEAYALLEHCGLIEPDHDRLNRMNGFLVLTAKGAATTGPVQFDRARVRALLHQEMLHPKLRGKIYSDFAANELDAAVNEAFRTVEIEVRQAAGLPEKENGQPVIGRAMMRRAFAASGPLSRPTDSKTECDALVGLFEGAISHFRNPVAHTRRTFEDALEAMEELMFASRLLRLVDDRRGSSGLR
jgi:uncharacterized protein (TIGR02391 family)